MYVCYYDEEPKERENAFFTFKNTCKNVESISEYCVPVEEP